MVEDIKKVASNIETIRCDRGSDGLGHPAVYYNFNEVDKVICGYCGKIFIREKK